MAAKPPSRKRALTAEEAELWATAMRDAKALRRQRRAERKAAADQHDAAGGTAATGPSRPEKKKASADRPEPRPFRSRPASPERPSPPPLARFEERQRRKLARNAETIDARLDLHGMRQRQAHVALRSFLLASAARGHRNVLVITGKGTRAEIERDRDYLAQERGVLRRLVPQWLGEQEFRSIVMSYTTASVRHGGEGALYVRLRKLDRER
jgi:DNA-nicking Smr family endonuclease